MTCLYQIRTFLASTECAVQSDEVIRDFLKQLLPFNLTKAEKLMLLNNRPVAESVLVSMIEECEERFTEEERGALLDITSSLPESLFDEPEEEEEEAASAPAPAPHEQETSKHAADAARAEQQWDNDENGEHADDAEFVNEKDAVDSEGEGD